MTQRCPFCFDEITTNGHACPATSAGNVRPNARPITSWQGFASNAEAVVASLYRQVAERDQRIAQLEAHIRQLGSEPPGRQS